MEFNLSKGPLIHLTLIKVNSEEFIVCFNMHHIISDGWSMGILSKELSLYYNHFAFGESLSLEPLAIQYADFAIWQRQWLEGERLMKQLEYWKDKLQGAPEQLDLITDKPRPQIASYQGKTVSFIVEKLISQKLNELAATHQSTLFMVLLASINVLLYRYTGGQQEDIVIGTPIANRRYKEIEGLIGFFVNTLAIRCNLGNNPTFIDLLAQVRETTLNAYDHQDVPFEQLVDHLGVSRHLARHPLFQVMLVLQNNQQSGLSMKGINDIEGLQQVMMSR